MTKFILSLPEEKRNIKDISYLLKYDDTVIGKYINKYNLKNLLIYKRSSYEDEIFNILSNEFKITNIIRNDRKILNGLEIDLYLPDYKFGIEFNGNYWHSELILSDLLYHQKKVLNAEKLGIQLFNIFEYEWENENIKNKIINRLKNILMKNKEKIPAKKCIIKKVNKKDKKIFLDENHIQGNDKSLIEYGLYYNNKLVSLMTFCKARFTKGHEWELSRFCSLNGYNIVGAASKLLKYFVDNDMKSKEKLVSYSDLAKSNGKLYDTLGFKLLSISKPSYVWWKNHENVLSRYQTQIKNELTVMYEKGYSRIFNAGNKVWSFQK